MGLRGGRRIKSGNEDFEDDEDDSGGNGLPY